MEPNYFTCTLGQAQQYQQDRAFATVNELIDARAESDGERPAAGFYEIRRPSSATKWSPWVLSFRDIQRGSRTVAGTLAQRLSSPTEHTVALLCASTADFLFTWLGLMRLGYAVLLIAPQCSASAIAHLCETCEVQTLIFDDIYEDLARKASAQCRGSKPILNLLPLPRSGQNIDDLTERSSSQAVLKASPEIDENSVAYLHHTSGTSSGMPKPIPQTHRAAVGVLPALDGRRAATFTTTPLYHGGIADLFRAWTSGALIWLFPGKDVPITAANVCRCLDISADNALHQSYSRVRYFSSVPYILQMMAGDDKGLKHLQDMQIVGVGGAAVPSEVGDKLVQQGVNLISRFGSAECGFLMSSHRQYRSDREWEYLRPEVGVDLLRFEERDNGLFELVVKGKWPHRAKKNREDGSYATSDLFMPHPTIPHAWRYHSRADSQLTLITGKKFDPAPLEDAIKASSSLIEDVLIFGDGRPYTGALLFRAKCALSLTDKEIMDQMAPIVEKLNQESQAHARLGRNMLISMPYIREGLAKSSKGTVLRKQAETRFTRNIENAYAGASISITDNVKDEEVARHIRTIILSVVGEDGANGLRDDTDLFSYGVDSVACMQIRRALPRLVPGATALPLSVVEDAGTIARLNDFILRLRSGQKSGDEDDQAQLMSDLVEEYKVNVLPKAACIAASHALNSHSRPQGLTVLLTGATGSMGSHILHQLHLDPRVDKIILLVRGTTATISRDRVMKALSSKQLPIPRDFDSKTTILPCKLSEPHLGLEDLEYEHLARTVDIVLHLAWNVNFLISLRTIARTHLSGLQNLLDLALQRDSDRGRPPPRFIFCSSVAAVSNLASVESSRKVPEHFVSDPRVSGPTGYARSKWVGEAICAEAHRATSLRGRISIARVGQLSGATDTGVWNSSEAYPLLLSSAAATGVLPDLQDEMLNWLPVDLAARAFVESALGPPAREESAVQTENSHIPVHHILNPNMSTTWSDLLRWISPHGSFEVVSPQDWLSRLAALEQDETTKRHPALRLLGFWRNAYGSAISSDDEAGAVEPDPSRSIGTVKYEMTDTLRVMPALMDASKAMDEAYVLKLWTSIQSVG